MAQASKKKYKVKTPSGNIVKLTKQQKKYADEKLAHPDKPLIEIAQEVYTNASKATASQIVNQNEKNKDISIYSEEQVNRAALTVVEIMNNPKSRDETRLKAADSVLDRAIGKPKQVTETHSTNLNLNVEASQKLADSFTEFLKQQTRVE